MSKYTQHDIELIGYAAMDAISKLVDSEEQLQQVELNDDEGNSYSISIKVKRNGD